MDNTHRGFIEEIKSLKTENEQLRDRLATEVSEVESLSEEIHDLRELVSKLMDSMDTKSGGGAENMTESRRFTLEICGQATKGSCLQHINTTIKALQMAGGNKAVSIDRQDLLHAVNFVNDCNYSVKIS